MRYGRAVAIAVTVALALAGCGGDSPTSPSDLEETVRVGEVSFSVNRASLGRDFMPIVVNPGPDGGTRLRGTVLVRAANEGQAVAFTVSAKVYDGKHTSYPVTVVAHDHDQETLNPGREVLWPGTIAAGGVQWVELRFTDGPYLPVGSRAAVVLTWLERGGRTGSMRTAEVEIGGTY